MKQLTFLFFFIFSFSCVFSQGQTDNWYFGDYVGLKFNSDGSVSTLTDGQMKVSEGCSTISDCNGSLLFYTDGENVWNKNHQIMVNGTGLFGRDTSTQAATIVKKPGLSQIYYIFTTSVQTSMGNSRYSEVDMSLQGGEGEVTNKNILLFNRTTEKLTIAKHSNGIDYWAITYNIDTNFFHAYLISSDGVSNSPILSYYPNIDLSGSMKVSPDGKKLAVCNFSKTALIFDFDNLNGYISSDPQALTNDGEFPYGVEFSPNSKVLYISCYANTYQFNLSVPNIKDTAIKIATGVAPNSGALQLGPNGKIYYAIKGTSKIGVINKPNVLGLGCDFNREGIDLYERVCRAGLPSFCASYIIPTITIKNLCLGSITEFFIDTNSDTSNILWDFGDGTTSSNPNPTHFYTNPGNYTVTVSGIASNDLCPLSKTINISAPPVASQLNEISLCGEAGINYNLLELDTTILGSQSPTVYGVAYFSSLLNAASHTNNLAKNNYPLSIGINTFYAKVYLSNNLSCFDIKPFNIKLISPPTFTMDETYFICPNNGSVNISLPSSFSSYIWKKEMTNPATTIGINQTINIQHPGNYSATIFENHGVLLCSTTKNFNVENSNLATFENIKISDFSNNNTITIEISGNGDYEFSIDGFNYQDSNFFSNLETGQYTVYVRNKNGCGIISRSVYLLDYPKFFTPNGDGYNDYWQVNLSIKEPNMIVNIFDRFGKLIVNFNGLDIGWDGNLNNRPLPSDDYWFIITRQNGDIFKGHFSLKR
jgi:gliding motility-associated-like protein